VNFDGKDNPVTGSVPNVRQAHQCQLLRSYLEKGLPGPGNKVTTVDSVGMTVAGVKTHDVQVYDKQ
jgi:hypothetical protein